MTGGDEWQGLREIELAILVAFLMGAGAAVLAHFRLKNFKHEVDRFAGLPSTDSIFRLKRLREDRSFGVLVAFMMLLAFLAFVGRP